MDLELTPAELELPRLKRVYYGAKSVDSYLPPLGTRADAAAIPADHRIIGKKNGLLAELQAVMGNMLVGTFAGSKAHNPLESVRACATAARAA